MKDPLRIAVLAVSASIAATLAGCNYVAVQTAPAKVAASSRSELAQRADKLFWNTLHSGDYDAIPQAMEAMTAAYLETPNDALTAAHVGWLHIWSLAENARLAKPTPTVTDHAVMARKYFQEAVALDPSDARFLGFLASAMLAEGSIHKDEKTTRQGYYTLLSSVDAWPEFNLFTAGYVMSGQAADSQRFKDGLEWQWRNLDECVGEKIDRRNPDYQRYMRLATTQGKKRVCWNSWIAPHNFEGFFLNLGDMLVKSGDWQLAQKIYANAKLTPEYASWKFAPLLEARIQNAQANVAVFAQPGSAKAGGAAMMGKSTFACVACHQQ
ncbi:MAG: hypothetical protein E6H58_20150 [Betaproteobacteria bacterium]|nr:MAG: hypothetical protein E6H58_20150 [Betaproteobacteria bacterium]